MNIIKVDPKTFSDTIYSMEGISKKTVEEHLKLYQGYVTKYNEIQEKLQQLASDDYMKANQTYSAMRELKVELSFAYGGIINHEIYFGHLGKKDTLPEGALMEQIVKDFGSFDNYIADMKASGMAARGWVWTAWNKRENRLFNYLGDSQNTFPVWEAFPIVALDTYEHAYFIDYGSARAKYLEAFFHNLDWKTVSESFNRLAK